MASVRDAFFNRIYELVQSGEDLYIVTADLGAPSLDDFRRDYPDRYISVGIAEQSLISVAAGMALGGKQVIAYGLNPFPVTRAFDQVRSLMAELKIPMTLCALNAGLCAAECGYTHMPIEDMAMMRTLSNVKVINPTDETISRKLAEDTRGLTYPRFIRFDKAIAGEFYDAAEIDLKKGFTVTGSQKNAALAVITQGVYVRETADMLVSHRYSQKVKLIDLYSIPVDEDALVEELAECDRILTVEENLLAGGIGSYVLELLSDRNLLRPVKRLGLKLKSGYYDVFTSRNFIRSDQGLDLEHISEEISSFVEEACR